MAVFKCKMCGGELNLIEDTTVCECEYCGTTQTVPSADNEKKMNLFNRANRLRFANEFDKAAGVFESIVAEFPEEAEAYWGLVLCKYGIEYVDDPATAKKVPTCHRTSYDGIFEDDNFQMALEYADAIANRVYREEAKEIDRLQKAILEVAEKEEPFDVFICYKETAEDGQRTKDSVLAQDMYDALTAKGYKVFFSRISLEDKLGQEYEPYIFAALNSARVMLAVGTKYEYFNAVWVKNEWARFLELIKKDKSKVLIPCYCDIDAYDMPLEFKNLQGQDMSKVGFIQDLVRGVEKIIPLGKGAEKIDSQAAPSASSSNVASLLERTELFLEDEEWKSAKEYCDKVLDIEPRNATAYLYQTCANYCKQNAKDLISIEDDFENSDSFKKAYRFADDNLKHSLDEIITNATQHRTEAEKCRQQKKEEQKRKQETKREKLKSVRKVFNSSRNIIACSYRYRIGLKTDGSVEIRTERDDGRECITKWTNIVSLACAKHSALIAGLKSNGHVEAYGNINVSYWENIIAVACGEHHIVGVRSDGSVTATGPNDSGECTVGNWSDIVAVACGEFHTVGLKADGRVVATGRNFDGQCNVSDWTDIVAIDCGSECTVGLKSNGRVVATGRNHDGRCSVSGWTDIVAVACGDFHTVGLKADGTVVATRGQEFDLKDIISVSCGRFTTMFVDIDGNVNSGWKLFNDENELLDMAKTAEKARLDSIICMAKSKMIHDDIPSCEEAIKLLSLIPNWKDAKKQIQNCEQKIIKLKEEEKERKERRSRNVCQHCGGEFKGLLTKKCMQCGKGKDY